MKVGDSYLCKKDFNYKLISVLEVGKYYEVAWMDGNLLQVRYGDNWNDVCMFHQKEISYGIISFWEYFYTIREVRKQKMVVVSNSSNGV
jgi:hypothetical protein